ncbi:hypothetical protein OAC51_01510 [Flavobacteriaceae bacterium]|nr:hypothetical protein [Flavobacteriaceae bacterium]
MSQINLNNKTFVLLENSENGEVNCETLFNYKQHGTLVTADYSGGPILEGVIIGQFQGSELTMLYQCKTKKKELKAGKATAQVSTNSNGRIELHMKWEWLTSEESGESVYIEQVPGS